VPELSSFMEKRVGVIVLDEVDEMVRNPGFFRQVVRIVEACKSARIFAFTATHSVRALGFVRDANGRDLVHINADDASRNNHTHEHHVVPSASLMPAAEGPCRPRVPVGGSR
jgi:superfamily II DNA/RNA helicase